MVIGNVAGMSNAGTIAISIALAFVFGYLLTMVPLLRADVAFRSALSLALVSDTVSIAVMEVVDNAIMLAVPGAMEAGLGDFRFWASLAASLAIAAAAAFPVVRWLISRGRGHAVVHRYHEVQGDAPSRDHHEAHR